MIFLFNVSLSHNIGWYQWFRAATGILLSFVSILPPRKMLIHISPMTCLSTKIPTKQAFFWVIHFSPSISVPKICYPISTDSMETWSQANTDPFTWPFPEHINYMTTPALTALTSFWDALGFPHFCFLLFFFLAYILNCTWLSV